MSSRTFTLDEAQDLVPVLESLLRTSIEGKRLMESVDAELQEIGHRVFLSGGMSLNVVHLARRKADREKAIQRVKDAMSEIDAMAFRSRTSTSAYWISPARWMERLSCSAGSWGNRRLPTGTA